MSKIGPITNMSKLIAEWVEKFFDMTAMMPDEPDIQADITLFSDIEKVQSNSNPDLSKRKSQQEKTRSSSGKTSDKIPVKRKN